MTDLKITIDQLKNYLGTGLKVRVLDNSSWNVSNTSLSPIHLADNCEMQFIQCYRLSDLDKFIPEMGFVPIEELLKIATEMIWSERIDPIGKTEILTEHESTGIIAYNETERVSFTLDKEAKWFDFALYVDGSEMKLDKFHLFQKLFQWHFWPFGDEYFEQGLVIDKLKI